MTDALAIPSDLTAQQLAARLLGVSREDLVQLLALAPTLSRAPGQLVALAPTVEALQEAAQVGRRVSPVAARAALNLIAH